MKLLISTSHTASDFSRNLGLLIHHFGRFRLRIGAQDTTSVSLHLSSVYYQCLVTLVWRVDECCDMGKVCGLWHWTFYGVWWTFHWRGRNCISFVDAADGQGIHNHSSSTLDRIDSENYSFHQSLHCRVHLIVHLSSRGEWKFIAKVIFP